MQLKFLLLGTFIVFSLFFGFQTHAIEESSSILMDIIPANPAPNESVTITLQSFSEDLNTANIAWFVNGKNVSSGAGKKSISVTAPGAGGEMTIVAKLTFAGAQTQVSTVIRPAEMVILWQAMDSHVPPFYKGKALPAPDTFVKVVAIPEIRSSGTLIDHKNMIYSWQKDYDNVAGANGYGNYFYIFRNDYLENSNTIGVTATTTDQKYSSVGTVNIPMYSPEISFYKKDNTLGTIWEKALSNDHFIQGSEIIQAVPYFISPKDIRRPDLIFTWSINDTPTYLENYKKILLPVAVPEGTSGTSKIELEIENTSKIFQTARKVLNIQF